MTNAITFGPQATARTRRMRSVMAVGLVLIALTACRQREPGSLSGNKSDAWTVHVRKVHEALAKKDISRAEWAWLKAYVTALIWNRGWESMIEVGDAALSIGEVTGFRKAIADRARQSYMFALTRARTQKSVHGVLRTARAFAALGDDDAVDQCLQVAKSLGAPVSAVLIAEKELNPETSEQGMPEQR